MTEPTTDVSPSQDLTFSLVQGDPPYQIQRRLGLIPRHGLGIPRRIFPYFVTSGLVTEAEESRFVAILRHTGRMRGSWLA